MDKKKQAKTPLVGESKKEDKNKKKGKDLNAKKKAENSSKPEQNKSRPNKAKGKTNPERKINGKDKEEGKKKAANAGNKKSQPNKSNPGKEKAEKKKPSKVNEAKQKKKMEKPKASKNPKLRTPVAEGGSSTEADRLMKGELPVVSTLDLVTRLNTAKKGPERKALLKVFSCYLEFLENCRGENSMFSLNENAEEEEWGLLGSVHSSTEQQAVNKLPVNLLSSFQRLLKKGDPLLDVRVVKALKFVLQHLYPTKELSERADYLTHILQVLMEPLRKKSSLLITRKTFPSYKNLFETIHWAFYKLTFTLGSGNLLKTDGEMFKSFETALKEAKTDKEELFEFTYHRQMLLQSLRRVGETAKLKSKFKAKGKKVLYAGMFITNSVLKTIRTTSADPDDILKARDLLKELYEGDLSKKPWFDLLNGVAVGKAVFLTHNKSQTLKKAVESVLARDSKIKKKKEVDKLLIFGVADQLGEVLKQKSNNFAKGYLQDIQKSWNDDEDVKRHVNKMMKQKKDESEKKLGRVFKKVMKAGGYKI